MGCIFSYDDNDNDNDNDKKNKGTKKYSDDILYRNSFASQRKCEDCGRRYEKTWKRCPHCT
jgi:hypothetical protein